MAQPLYGFGALLGGQYVLEHRVYRAVAALLRHRIAVREEKMRAGSSCFKVLILRRLLALRGATLETWAEGHLSCKGLRH